MPATVTATRSSVQRVAVQAGIGLVATCLVTYVLTKLSLDNVPGATRRPDGGCCDTNFVNTGWWYAMIGLSIPIWWLTRTVTWAGVLAVVLTTYATFHVASTVVDRYARSGWSDGLEYFVYVISAGQTLVFVVAAVIGALHSRRHRGL